MPSITTSAGIGSRAASAFRPDNTTLGTAQRLGLIALGLLWLIDGLLQLQPYFFHHFISGVVAPNASGQPGIIGDPITQIANLLKPVQAPFNAFAAIVEVAIGVALLTRRAIKPVLLVSFAWALGIWFAGEGMSGRPPSSTPNAFTGVIGTAPLYILAGLIVWPREQQPGQTTAATGLLGRTGARAVWVVLWTAAAVSWLLPSNDGSGALRDLFSGAPSGAGWLSSLQSSAASAVAGHGTALAIVLAIVSAGIGVSVLSSRTERIGLIASIPLLLIGWVLVEGFGALFTGTATDVGTNLLMILLAVQLFALSVQRAPHAARDNAVPAAAVA